MMEDTRDLVRVPVNVDFNRAGDGAFSVTIRARKRANDYPKFRGQLTLLPSGDGCALELRGRYSPPHGFLGDFVDSTFMRGTAQASLQRFLDYLSSETVPLALARSRKRV